jgi:hypothetical protein
MEMGDFDDLLAVVRRMRGQRARNEDCRTRVAGKALWSVDRLAVGAKHGPDCGHGI